MLVSDVARRVRSMSGNSGTALASDTDIYDLINDAQVELNLETHFLATTGAAIPTVAGTWEYALPSSFIAVKLARLVDYWALEPSDSNRIMASDPLWKIAGKQRLSTPRYYTVEGPTIQLYPTPDAVYSLLVTCISTPTQVAATNAPLTLPEYLHPCVVRLCLAAIKEKDEDFEAASFIRAETYSKALILIDKARHANEQTYPSVRDYDNSDRGYDRVDW